MQCRQCGRENPDQARFCMACGARLRVVCPQCATELPPDPDLRFCFSCGAQLAQEQPVQVEADQMAEDRRLVTVLFADLAGWTQMVSTMDPEDVQAIQQAYFGAVTPPIEQHGGSVEKYIGDAVLAVFGVPTVHEDDPERALRAALAMQEAIAALNMHLPVPTIQTSDPLTSDPLTSGPLTSDPLTLSLRIGVHTGLVVSRVDEDGHFVVTGDTVNLAARLQGAAEPGTVLISADTARLATGAFELADLGAIPVKGKAEPVAVHRVVGPKATPAKLRGLSGLESPLVGRDAEMATLRKTMERLERGVGGIVTIVGEAGIGKSRLVAELRKLQPPAAHRPPPTVTWIEGRCLSYGGSIAYLLWLDLLRSALGSRLDDPPETVREALRQWVERLCPDCVEDIYPCLAQLMALPLPAEIAATIGGLDGEELKRRTFQAVDAVITAAANRQPLVIVCEDLHWADPSSLALLEHVLALTDKTGLLVVGVFRPEPEHAVWRLRETIAREYRHRHTDLWLRPLSAGESETLVSNLLAANIDPGDQELQDFPSRLIDRILAQAEGNPFYVEEVLRALIDGGVLARDANAAGRWVVTREVAEIEMPSTLQGVLTARIDRLQEDTRRILQLAAVIGRVFLHRVLAEIAREEQALDEKLLTLQRQELIRERARIPELEYIFKHELTREAAYNGILKQQRRLFHRQVAEALEGLFPDRVDEQLDLLGYHWELAGEMDKAVAYLLRAAQRNVQQLANQEAIAHFMRGLALLDSLPESPERDEKELAMQMGLGISFSVTRAYGAPEAARAWGRALELSRQMGDPAPLWLASGAIYAHYLQRAEHQTALEIAQQIADADQRLIDRFNFPFSRGNLGMSCLYLGDFEGAKSHLEATVACYDREQHHGFAFVFGSDIGVPCLSYLSVALWCLGHVDQARARSQEALDLAQAIDHPFTLAMALSMAGRLRTLSREAPAVMELAQAGALIARQRGYPFYEDTALGLYGWGHVAQGALEQGAAEIEASLACCWTAGTRFNCPQYMAWLAEAKAKMGRIDEGLQLLSEALALVGETGERFYEAEIRRLQGELLRELGRAAEAEACYGQSIQVARQQRAKSFELRTTISLGRLWRSQGRTQDAQHLLAEIYGSFTEGFDTPDLVEARVLLDELSPP